MDKEPVTKTTKTQSKVESNITSFYEVYEISRQIVGDDSMYV